MIDFPLNALIVVVDDAVLERMGASFMFLDAGYRVLEAGNADEGDYSKQTPTLGCSSPT